MVTLDRWQTAQAYERGFWRGVAGQIADGSLSQLDWYGWRADQLAAWLRGLGQGALLDGEGSVVEIGSGPIGISPYLPARARIAVDPLADFYGANEALVALRDPAVSYRQGVGESLPCDGASCDLAVMENCIDHVRDVHAVMEEIRRVLRPDGVLYLTVNCRTWWGFGVHRVLSRLRLDPGHPHTFTRRRLETLLRAHGFELLDLRAGSYAEAAREDLCGPSLRARLKGILGTSEFLVSAVARRGSGAAA